MTRQYPLAIALAVPVLLFASLSVTATAQQVDVNAIGPQVGQNAPAFNLPDQNGQPQSLATVAGPKGTMLVFFRSADW
jgi:hypothetical protein